ncbi:transcription factor Ovo-like 2 [Engraulis encrasicolus]|uniref:transcription factor Ovo-like 2 n=1 Tax=Engraulis encrasicolus TaxID=184585 RepID=UPI002FD05411
MSTIEFRVAFILDDFAKKAASEITKLFESNFAAYIEELNKKQRHIDQLTKTLEAYRGTINSDDGHGVEYEAHSWVKLEPEELDNATTALIPARNQKLEPEELDNATTALIPEDPGDFTRSESDFGALEFEPGMLVSSQTQTSQLEDIMSSVPGRSKTESLGSDASGIEPSGYEETPHTKTNRGRRGGKTKKSTGLQHICNLCHKRFSRATALVRHRFDHKQEGLQVCCWCGAVFPGKSQLMVHMRSHTGKKAFYCDWCAKAYDTKATLKVHMRRCHGSNLK